MPTDATIVWFRRDLRLEDQPALHAAVQRGGAVVPVFIWDPEGESPWAPGAASRWWLGESLRALDDDLAALGSRLITRAGRSERVLPALAREVGATAVTYGKRYEPSTRVQEERVAEALRSVGAEPLAVDGGVLFPPTDVCGKSGKPYRVFTPYYNACLAHGVTDEFFPAPGVLAEPTAWPASDDLAALRPKATSAAPDYDAYWRPGAAGATAALNRFLSEASEDYAQGRDLPGEAGTSRLSPHLHFGEISPRRVWHAATARLAVGSSSGATRGLEAFRRQLVWREFSAHLLHHAPHTQEAPLREAFEAFPWRDDVTAFHAWQEGRTGYPYIDAGMRELNETGWMHNRVRMAAASFLVKHLLLPWQLGAHYFWERLVDADLANNTMGWQWTAGCGADAAPYFRIFNPITQGEKFDAEGGYVRRWVPELETAPDHYLMRPWEADPSELAFLGVVLGETYPLPVVDHRAARERALAAYASTKKA